MENAPALAALMLEFVWGVDLWKPDLLAADVVDILVAYVHHC